jgi:hypothetical protein
MTNKNEKCDKNCNWIVADKKQCGSRILNNPLHTRIVFLCQTCGKDRVERFRSE